MHETNGRRRRASALGSDARASATLSALAVLVSALVSPVATSAEGNVPGVRVVAAARAVVNFADLAREEASAPMERRAPVTRRLMPLPQRLPLPDRIVLAPEETTTSAGEISAWPQALSPAPSSSFLALGDNNTRIPPDTNGAVGPAHLMVALNTQVRVQDRAGGVLSTVSLDAFWASLGNPDVFDPRLLYDPFAGRWMFAACANPASASSSVLLGVSQTDDPTGSWNLYRVDTDAANLAWADYPNVGFNKDWIAIQANMFAVSNNTFQRTHIYVFDKADLYAGGSKPATLLSASGIGGTQVPAATYDDTLATLYLVEEWDGASGLLRVYDITGAIGSEVLTAGSFVGSAANPWSPAVPGEIDLAPQLGTLARIQTNDARMQRVVYRNGALWATHNVLLPAGGSPTRSAVQWWQFTPAGTVLQRGRIDDPSGATFYAFPSLAVNKDDDVLIGYSRFSATQFASANYAFRSAGDPAGTLQADTVLKTGEAPYFKTLSGTENRWGDYSSTVVDPVNDTDLWTIQEYAASPSGGFDRWGTWWGRVVPPGSTTATATPTPPGFPTPTATPTLSVTPTPHVGPTPNWVKCQRTIAREGAKLAQRRTAGLAACELAKLVGKLPASTDCRAEPTAATRIATASSRLTVAVDRACGGADKACGGDLTHEAGGAPLAWPATCPGFAGASCSNSIGSDDCTGIAECLACVTAAAVDRAIALYFDDRAANGASDDAALDRCRRTIGRASSALLIASSKALRRCWDARLRGLHANDCTPPSAGDGRAEAAIAKAASKKDAAICRACGRSDKRCAGGGDFTPSSIGFTTCDDVQVPFAGPSCSRVIADRRDIVDCVGCVSEFTAECLDRAQVPEFGSLPSECRP